MPKRKKSPIRLSKCINCGLPTEGQRTRCSKCYYWEVAKPKSKHSGLLTPEQMKEAMDKYDLEMSLITPFRIDNV